MRVNLTRMLVVFVLVLGTLAGAFAIDYPVVEAHGVVTNTGGPYTTLEGYVFTTNESIRLQNVTRDAASTGTYWYVKNSSSHIICKELYAESQAACDLEDIGLYSIVGGSDGGSYNRRFLSGGSFPYVGSVVLIAWNTTTEFVCDAYTVGSACGGGSNTTGFPAGEIYSMTFDAIPPPVGNPVLTLNLQNIVNQTLITGYCALFTQGGSTNYSACNTTGEDITYNESVGIYNITFYNITSGHGSPVYFNVTQPNYNFSSTTTITPTTYQAVLSVTASQLYTLTSINVFNTTNNKITNTTTSGLLQLKANNGSNQIRTSVGGNFSINSSCVVPSPFTNTACVVTGVYDAWLLVNATNISAPVIGFSINLTNLTLGIDNTTTGTNINYSLLQGYAYYLTFNKTTLSDANTTLTLTSPGTTYTFVVFPAPSVNFTFYDEITNTLITENISLEIINNGFSQNHTVSNSVFQANLTGKSGITTFRYSSLSYEQRDYIINLDPGVNYIVNLYDINISESDVVMTTVTDTSNTPIEGALVSLLRYFVECNCYRIVQMSFTSGAGQTPFYVQALDGHYKWSVSYQNTTYFLSTTSEQINSDTRVFILDLGTDYYAGYQGLDGLSYLTTYNVTTGALTFTWNDPTSTVTGACLDATYLSGTSFVSVGVVCSSGAVGSQFLALDNTTAYSWTASVNTTSVFTPYLLMDSGSITVAPTFDYGNQGIFLAIAILIVLVLIFSYSATAVTLISVAGVILINILGLMPFIASFITALSVLTLGIVLYVMRS